METPLKPTPVSDVCFLLIQGEIIGVADQPHKLNYADLDRANNFQVAIGCVNEFGKPEIIGIVAEGYPVPGCFTWRVSSELDGYNRLVGGGDTIGEWIRYRLQTYWYQNRFVNADISTGFGG
jgi:hypothetical protein